MATSMEPEQKAVYQKQLEKLDASRDIARGRLNELAGIKEDVSASPAKADAAAADAAAAVATGRISMADANKRLTAAGFKPLAAPEESKKSPQAAPTKDQETKTAKPASESGPSYAKWMAAKERMDEINAAASKMSPDRKADYLRSRLPEAQAEIDANKNYRTY